MGYKKYIFTKCKEENVLTIFDKLESVNLEYPREKCDKDPKCKLIYVPRCRNYNGTADDLDDLVRTCTGEPIEEKIGQGDDSCLWTKRKLTI